MIEIPRYQAQIGITDRGPNVRLDPRLAGTSALTQVGNALSQAGRSAQQIAAAGWERRNVAFVSEQRAEITRAITERRIEAERGAVEGAPGFVAQEVGDEGSWFTGFREERMAAAQALADQGAINGDAVAMLGSTLDRAYEQQFQWAAGFAAQAEAAQQGAQLDRTMATYEQSVRAAPGSLARVQADAMVAVDAAVATGALDATTAPGYRLEVERRLAEAAQRGLIDSDPTAWLDGRTVTVTDENAPRGVRVNNPLNIAQSSANWNGRAGTNPDPFLEAFVTPEHGLAAGIANLRSYRDRRGIRTIGEAIATWAPRGHGDNDPEAYARQVAAISGLSPDTPLNPDDPRQMALLLPAMVQVEQGMQPYGAEVYLAAMEMAGLAPPDDLSVMPANASVAQSGGAPIPGVTMDQQDSLQAYAERQQREQRAALQGEVQPRLEAEMALLELGLAPPPDAVSDAQILAAWGPEQGAEMVAARASAYALQGELHALRYQDADAQQAAVARWRAVADDDGRTAEERAEAARRANTLAEAAAAIEAARIEDPVGFVIADSPAIAAGYNTALQGVTTPEALTALRNAGDAAVTLQRQWGQPENAIRRLPEAFTGAWLNAWDGGTPDQQLAQLAGLTGAFGRQAPAVLAELRSSRPEIAHLGGLMAANAAPATLVDALTGYAVPTGERVALGPQDRRRVEAAVLGGAFGWAGETRTQVLDVAAAIYHTRAARAGIGPDDLSAGQAIYERALQEAAGGRFDNDGNQWGGLVDHNGIQTVVPSDIRADDFTAVIDAANPADIVAAAAGGIAPRYADGTVLPPEAFQDAYFVAIDDGQYALALNEPWGPDPQWVAGGGDNGLFVIDIRALAAMSAVRGASGATGAVRPPQWSAP